MGIQLRSQWQFGGDKDAALSPWPPVDVGAGSAAPLPMLLGVPLHMMAPPLRPPTRGGRWSASCVAPLPTPRPRRVPSVARHASPFPAATPIPQRSVGAVRQEAILAAMQAAQAALEAQGAQVAPPTPPVRPELERLTTYDPFEDWDQWRPQSRFEDADQGSTLLLGSRGSRPSPLAPPHVPAPERGPAMPRRVPVSRINQGSAAVPPGPPRPVPAPAPAPAPPAAPVARWPDDSSDLKGQPQFGRYASEPIPRRGEGGSGDKAPSRRKRRPTVQECWIATESKYEEDADPFHMGRPARGGC